MGIVTILNNLIKTTNHRINQAFLLSIAYSIERMSDDNNHVPIYLFGGCMFCYIVEILQFTLKRSLYVCIPTDIISPISIHAFYLSLIIFNAFTLEHFSKDHKIFNDSIYSFFSIT